MIECDKNVDDIKLNVNVCHFFSCDNVINEHEHCTLWWNELRFLKIVHLYEIQ